MLIEIDPTVDYAFKRVFGSSDSNSMLLDLINSVHQNKGLPALKSVEILDPFDAREHVDDKLAILDIKAIDELGQVYNIEMQMHAGKEYPARAVYYLSGIYRQQIQQGDDYSVLKLTAAIHIVISVMFPEYEQYHWHFELRDSINPQVKLTNLLSLHIIELPKFNLTIDQVKDPFTRWLYLLKCAKGLDPDKLPEEFKGPAILKALQVLINMALNPTERQEYEDRLHAERSYTSALKAERNEGRAEGLARGEQMGLARGEQMGLARGYLTAIERNLAKRFPDRAPGVIPAIKNIADIAKLEEFMEFSFSVNSIDEIESRLREMGLK